MVSAASIESAGMHGHSKDCGGGSPGRPVAPVGVLASLGGLRLRLPPALRIQESPYGARSPVHNTEAKPRSGLGGSAGGNPAAASVALTLPLGPSTTLASAYEAVGKEFGLGMCWLMGCWGNSGGMSRPAH